MVVRFLLVLTVTLPKFRVAGPRVNLPAGVVLPDRGMARVGSEAFEATEIVPWALPLDFGAKMTLKVMLFPSAKLSGRFRPVRLNPPPVMVACEIVTLDSPEFVSVSYRRLLPPTWTRPKLTLDGLAVSDRSVDSGPSRRCR